MMTLAITGSIGMGKSTVAAMFAEAGIPTFDADATVRMRQGPGGRLVPEIESRFPGTTRDGAVDRDALSTAVLGDPDELAALEAIVHPAVHHERTRFIVENGDVVIGRGVCHARCDVIIVCDNTEMKIRCCPHL